MGRQELRSQTISAPFLRGSPLAARLIAAVVASILLMTADHRFGHLEKVRSALSALVYPLQYLVSLPAAGLDWMSESLVTRKALLRENARLKEEQLLLGSQLQRFAVLEQENRRLRELLESSLKRRERVLVAELLAVELEPFRRQVIINKGQRDGAFYGQPVVDVGGIMGQVVHVGPFSSTVLLITDPSHALPVQINRNGLRAIAVGTGQDGSLLLEHLPSNADIRRGDLVVSSGLGRRFPSGYPVGVVEDIRLEPSEPFAKVTVTPSARPGQSREVLLVWPFETADDSTLGMAGLAFNP
ncbi:MAG: rod shape-determining protein MreC [Gammaproteobacteria bacterium]|nr:rod shape-determining protein MreC [Gammaproteobacteria bacterium]